ncbi:hypothetical protein OC844_005308 [Tilletia horrida]|nr:hypothetical protein OC844_005308 [Tilletia horrida]
MTSLADLFDSLYGNTPPPTPPAFLLNPVPQAAEHQPDDPPQDEAPQDEAPQDEAPQDAPAQDLEAANDEAADDEAADDEAADDDNGGYPSDQAEEYNSTPEDNNSTSASSDEASQADGCSDASQSSDGSDDGADMADFVVEGQVPDSSQSIPSSEASAQFTNSSQDIADNDGDAALEQQMAEDDPDGAYVPEGEEDNEVFIVDDGDDDGDEEEAAEADEGDQDEDGDDGDEEEAAEADEGDQDEDGDDGDDEEEAAEADEGDQDDGDDGDDEEEAAEAGGGDQVHVGGEGNQVEFQVAADVNSHEQDPSESDEVEVGQEVLAEVNPAEADEGDGDGGEEGAGIDAPVEGDPNAAAQAAQFEDEGFTIIGVKRQAPTADQHDGAKRAKQEPLPPAVKMVKVQVQGRIVCEVSPGLGLRCYEVRPTIFYALPGKQWIHDDTGTAPLSEWCHTGQAGPSKPGLRHLPARLVDVGGALLPQFKFFNATWTWAHNVKLRRACVPPTCPGCRNEAVVVVVEKPETEEPDL